MIIRLSTALCLIAIVLLVEACASARKAQHTNWAVRVYNSRTGEAVEADAWVCEAFRPIGFTDQDSPATRTQIAEHNAVWRALCPQDTE